MISVLERWGFERFNGARANVAAEVQAMPRRISMFYETKGKRLRALGTSLLRKVLLLLI